MSGSRGRCVTTSATISSAAILIPPPISTGRVLERYVNEHVNGTQNHEKLLWGLLNLEIWHREYGMSA